MHCSKIAKKYIFFPLLREKKETNPEAMKKNSNDQRHQHESIFFYRRQCRVIADTGVCEELFPDRTAWSPATPALVAHNPAGASGKAAVLREQTRTRALNLQRWAMLPGIHSHGGHELPTDRLPFTFMSSPSLHSLASNAIDEELLWLTKCSYSSTTQIQLV